VVIAVLFAFLSAGCETGEVKSVVLVTVDGLSPGQASRLAGFDEKAAFFEDALTPSPSTLPAMATVMTGMHPLTHGVKGASHWRLTGPAITLAEMFQVNEWRTAAMVGASNLGPETGLDQGFDVYKWDFVSVPAGPFAEPEHEPAAELVDKALGWVNFFGDKPFFLWVHFGDLARGWASPAGGNEEGLEAVSFAIKRLVDGLPHKGEKSLIIITAPAANAGGAHGERGHGTLVYQSTVRVPLLVRGPAIKPRRISSPASLEDVAPTVAGLAGFHQPPGVTGRNLAPALRGGRGPDKGRRRLVAAYEPFYVWGLSPLFAVVEGKYKLIGAAGGKYELYNLASDPGENDDLYEAGKAPAPRLTEGLESLRERLKIPKNYAEALIPAEDPGGDLPSPMDKMEALRLFSDAAALYREGKLSEAYDKLEDALKIHPGNRRAAVAMAAIADKIMPVSRRVDTWSRARRLSPKDPMVLTSLARAYYDAGASGPALVLLNDALAQESENPTGRELAARILEEKAFLLKGEQKLNLLKKALQHQIKAIQVSRNNPETYYRFSRIALDMADAYKSLPEENQPAGDERAVIVGSYEKAAERALKDALRLDPDYAEARRALEKLLTRKGEKAEADKRPEKRRRLKSEANGAAETGPPPGEK